MDGAPELCGRPAAEKLVSADFVCQGTTGAPGDRGTLWVGVA